MPNDGNATLLQEGATLGRFIFVPYSFRGLPKEPVLSLSKDPP